MDYATPEFYQRYPMAAENYSGRIVETPDKVSGLKIGGWASDALRLNWNKTQVRQDMLLNRKRQETGPELREFEVTVQLHTVWKI